MRQKFSVAWIVVLRNGFASGWWEPRVDASQEVVSLENEKFRCAASLHVIKRREKCAADWMKLSSGWSSNDDEWELRLCNYPETSRRLLSRRSRKQEATKVQGMSSSEEVCHESCQFRFTTVSRDSLLLSRTQMALKSFPPPTIAQSDETTCLSSGPQRRTIAK